jgi:hypothetical protein
LAELSRTPACVVMVYKGIETPPNRVLSAECCA